MIHRHFVRCLNSSPFIFSSINKSDLSRLRKKTGYTFANCKKALEINKDFESAEKWLKEQAQALGWSKANKLGGRSTLQGLIGISTEKNVAVMLEVNCETDFVARNKKFKSLVELVTESCLQQFCKMNNHHQPKVVMEGEELKSIPGPDGKSLVDHTVLAIADLGENLNLRRALCYRSEPDNHLAVYAHPIADSQNSKVMMGKYGALITYKSEGNDIQVQQFARQLCQHIVGMNPKKIGVFGEDEPADSIDDEEVMINQEFLLDPDLTVGQFMFNNGLQVVDFARIECGESVDNTETPVQIRASG